MASDLWDAVIPNFVLHWDLDDLVKAMGKSAGDVDRPNQLGAWRGGTWSAVSVSVCCGRHHGFSEHAGRRVHTAIAALIGEMVCSPIADLDG